MHIARSPMTGGAGMGRMPSAQVAHADRQPERPQKRKDNQPEKLSDSSSLSPKQSSGAKVIVGSGGDVAILSMGKTPAATAQAEMGQKALLDSINLPATSEEFESAVADLDAGAENLRQREATLDAELARHVKDLAQIVRSSDSADSAGAEEMAVDDSETIMEQIASRKEEKMMREEQLRRRDAEQAAGNATQVMTPDAKDVTPTENPAPAPDGVRHVEGYL